MVLGDSKQHPALVAENCEERPARIDAGEHARAHKRVLHHNHIGFARRSFARVHRHGNAEALGERVREDGDN